MYISASSYHRISMTFGLLLVLYGGGSIVSYALYVMTGVNGLTDFTNGMGLLFLALMGAMSFPLGVALFKKGDHSRLLLIIVSASLTINALLRLSILLVPELTDLTGSATPIGETFVFGLLAVLAVFFRPTDSPAHATRPSN